MNCVLVILHCDFLTVMSVIQKISNGVFEIFFFIHLLCILTGNCPVHE